MNTITIIVILVVKKPIDADYSILTEEIETNPKARKFKVGDRVRTTEHKNIFSKGLH